VRVSSPEAPARILVVDDDPSLVDYLCEMLREHGWEVTGVTSGKTALEHIDRGPVDLVLADVEMPKMRGLDLLRAVLSKKPAPLVILMTAFGSIDMAVLAVRSGAADFVTKPFRIEVVYLAIERALRERDMRRELHELRGREPNGSAVEIVARSSSMQKAIDVARRAAKTDATVLLTGETGTGKGTLARFIHESSDRSPNPFVQLNCAALPESLADSELFGVSKGAFTDARTSRDGLFVAADGGTLLLDEIGELSSETQAKLLRVLEAGRVRPLGRAREVPVDVRLIAATNHPLEELIRERRFRRDLFYRLNVIRIEVPPLRERREDILPLVDSILRRTCDRLKRGPVSLSSSMSRRLLSQDWPGNVRELANTIERAVVLADEGGAVVDDLLLPGELPDAGDLLRSGAVRGLPLAEVERAYVRAVVDGAGGNKAAAARILGIDRRTLYRKL
jgi:DNA-binding NtrC family response regulator